MDVVEYEIEGWGVGEIWFDNRTVVNHELPRAARRSNELVTNCYLQQVVDEIRAYFRGEPVSFDDVAVDLGWATPFQMRVAAALRAIPYGETVTYGELAALAGHPNAQRAAGTFCAHNRFPLFVPCHRVVAADGLGSYGSLGLEYKRRLLALERAF